MKIKSPLLIAPTMTAALWVTACGSGTPGIDNIRSALDNPTGSVQDKGAVTAAAQRKSSAGSTTDVQDSNPFSAGLGLTAANKPTGLNPLLAMRPFFRHLEKQSGRTIRVQGLSTSETDLDGFGSCLEQAINGGSIQGDASSFSASFEVDFDRCAAGGMSGQLSVDMSGEFDQSSGDYALQATYVYANVCMTLGGRMCQDGTLEIEGEGRYPTLGSADLDTTMTVLSAWRLDTLIEADQRSWEFVNKGGLEMKLDASGSSTNGSFRMVVYIVNQSGEEVSYTLTVQFTDFDGSFSIKGKDGELRCELSGNTGSCTGDLGVLEWGDDEWEQAYDAFSGL